MMTTLDFGTHSEYSTRFSSSPVFECALSIAAFTREDIHDKLEPNLDHFRAIRTRMSDELKQEIRVSGEVHSWRNLLFLAHRCPHLSDSPWKDHMKLFLGWMSDNEPSLKELAAPYLGDARSSELHDALSGNETSQQNLIRSHHDNPVVHLNLRYLFSIDSHTFLTHLRTLLERWYNEVFIVDMESTMTALQRDLEYRKQLSVSMQPSHLVRSVTKGSELRPVPGTDTLWFIPQFAYRPFTIINYLPHCVVYYYPVADEFVSGGTDHTQMTQVAALHKALGDVSRLRLLMLIRHHPKSLAELTDILGATKSNIHHHLTLLRTAGVVRVNDGVYAIDQDAILKVGDELRGLLKP
ncbi:winged helix-turn-helix transcriptional regulator [Alicyclobacillus curvatus]|nr:winged helix-turn-helix transcriptional regulator [Alicyclobacillus curvatus]